MLLYRFDESSERRKTLGYSKQKLDSISFSHINYYNSSCLFMCKAIMRQLYGCTIVANGRRAIVETIELDLDFLVRTFPAAIVHTIEPASEALRLKAMDICSNNP